MGEWFFSKLHKTDARRGTHEGNQFRVEQTAEGESAISSTLIREILQNSIDAHSEQRSRLPVRVRIAIHETTDSPSSSRLKTYFYRFREAAKDPKINVPFRNDGTPDLPCRFLVAEDFGTSGLEGDVFFDDPEKGNAFNEGFFWFWRNLGLSGKTSEQLGSYGLGKTVYRVASALWCMMGLTIRESDHRKLLMGQAVLPGPHQFQRKKYQPEGWWCRNAKEAEKDDDILPLPIESEDELRQFLIDWKLTRRDEPGLSVVSPYIPDNLTSLPLLQSVCVNFFVPILQGKLVVVIDGRETGEVHLDREHLEDVCKRIEWKGSVRTKRHIPPPISFVENCVKQKPLIETNYVGKQKLPHWTQESEDPIFPEETLEQLRQDYADRNPIGVHVRMAIHQANGPILDGEFDVWLCMTDISVKTECYYVRDLMTITRVGGSAPKQGLHSFVLISPGPLAELLAMTEGPAHEDWDKSSARAELQKWKTGWKGRVDFVRDAVKGLVGLLTPPVTKPNYDLLRDYFSIDPPENSPRKRRSNGKSPIPQEKELYLDSVSKWFRISRYFKEKTSGFRIARSYGMEKPAKTDLRIIVAYDVPGGDPLKWWSPLDFRIILKEGEALQFGGHAATLKRPPNTPENAIILHPKDEDFEFYLYGFDPYRDLFIRVNEIPEEEESDHA